MTVSNQVITLSHSHPTDSAKGVEGVEGKEACESRVRVKTMEMSKGDTV